jgi:hypothetical protein
MKYEYILTIESNQFSDEKARKVYLRDIVNQLRGIRILGGFGNVSVKSILSIENMQKIYSLTCEDASSLGGPMGSEHTTHLFTKPFSSFEKAYDCAKKFAHLDSIDWTKIEYKSEWSADTGAYIFKIKLEKVL